MNLPRVNVGLCVKIADGLSTLRRTICGFCGSENIATGDMWICVHCESPNSTSTLTLKLNDTQLVQQLSNVNNYLSSSNYQGAISEYAKIIEKYKEPGFLYYYGLLHIQYSNSQIAEIRYDRKGFMEENSLLRENGSKLVSTAKRIWSKAELQASASIRAGLTTDDLTTFTLFMLSIKLRKMKTAKKCIEILEKVNNPILLNYANMVFNAEAGNPKDVVKYATQLLQKGQFSANALYYIAWALLKAERYKESLVILRALEKQLHTDNIVALNSKLESAIRSY